MKKLLFASLCLLSAMGFSSCDEDAYQGMALSGCWEGDFGMSYDYYDRYNRIQTVNCYDTDLEFVPYSDSYSSGYGYQIDYYNRGPYDEIYHSFTWEVRNGVIYMDYRGERQLSTAIRDYQMDNDYLSGYFVETGTHFSLRKYRDYYDWTPYVKVYGDYRSGYGYGYHDNRYYAPTRNADGQQETDEKPVIIRYYNRYSTQQVLE